MAAEHDDKTNPERDPEKTVDLPPYGPRNPDPITNAPGSHPIETGIGAALGGAASGLAVGALTAGPLGAVAGAIAGGAVAGGLAGKGIGEIIDPTTEDNWIREALRGESDHPTEEELAAARRAFRYGLASQCRFPGRTFRDVEDDLRAGWEASGETMPWRGVWKSARAGFDRTLELVHPMDGSDIRRSDR
jgi:hypothetical protein